MNNVIPVGFDNNAEYHAYGDDSQFGDTLVYAFVIINSSQVLCAEQQLHELKQSYSFPNNTDLHCRVLCNYHERKRNNLSHLSAFKVKSILRKAIRIINNTPMLVRYGCTHLSTASARLGAEIKLIDSQGGPPMVLPICSDPKGFLGILMQTCFAVAPDNSEGPLASQCKIIVSEDKTKVRFIGKEKRRADHLYNGFSDIGADAGRVFQLQPNISNCVNDPLLQLADVAAYVCAHALSKSKSKDFLHSLFASIRYRRSAEFMTD